MEESKAITEAQFKLLDLAERESEKIIARNSASEFERYLNYVEKKLETYAFGPSMKLKLIDQNCIL